MTKTIVIKSRRSYLYDTPQHIVDRTYEYYSASFGVEFLIKDITQYNDQVEPKQAILPIVKYTKPEEAKVKLKGKKFSICRFIAVLCADRNITSKYDIET